MDELTRRIQQLVETSGHLTLRELLRELRLPRAEREAVRRAVRELRRQKLVRRRGKLLLPPPRARSVQAALGRVHRHPEGFGFVILDRGGADLFVPEEAMCGAMHDDRVEVTIERRRGRLQGRVLRVLERAREEVAGRLREAAGNWYLEPTEARACEPFRVDPPEPAAGARPGDLAVARVDRYPTGASTGGGHVTRLLGRPDDPDALEALVAFRFELPGEFDQTTLAEAAAAAGRALDPAGRLDLRELPVFTVDPADARDFDDAISLAADGDGWRLGIHIADVSWFVRPGSALESAARERATSVYLPRRVIPMLPPALSHEACSLQPGVDRAALSVLAEIDVSGAIGRVELARSLIRSRARLTYEEFQQFLDGDLPGELDPGLGAAARAAPRLLAVLLAARAGRGAPDLDLDEPRLERAGPGEPVAVLSRTRLAAHRFIEEAMIVANRVVAGRVAAASPGVYRIHEPPDPRDVAQFKELAARLGVILELPETPDPAALARALAGLPRGPLGAVLRSRALRALKLARYDLSSTTGHYGLALRSYCHFTSPIRRYPDLIMHRLLVGLLEGDGGPVQVEGLRQDADWSSRRERAAEAAERESLRIEAARALARRGPVELEGYVCDILGGALVVRFLDVYGEGLLPLDDLPGARYRAAPDRIEACPHGPGPAFRLADRVTVAPVEIDIPSGRVGLAYVSGPRRG